MEFYVIFEYEIVEYFFYFTFFSVSYLNAQVTYVDYSPDLQDTVIAQTFSGIYSAYDSVDLDMDGNKDFLFLLEASKGGSNGSSYVSVVGLNGNLIAGDSTSPSQRNAFSYSDYDSITGSTTFYMGKLLMSGAYAQWMSINYIYGYWNGKYDAQPGYLGLRFYGSGTWYYAWLRARPENIAGVSGYGESRLTLMEYAYSPLPLAAGDGSPTQGINVNNQSDVCLLAYPNPASENFALKIGKEHHNKPITLKLFDLQMKEVKEISFNAGSGISVTRGDLQKGIYFYKVFSESNLIYGGKIEFE